MPPTTHPLHHTTTARTPRISERANHSHSTGSHSRFRLITWQKLNNASPPTPATPGRFINLFYPSLPRQKTAITNPHPPIYVTPPNPNKPAPPDRFINPSCCSPHPTFLCLKPSLSLSYCPRTICGAHHGGCQ